VVEPDAKTVCIKRRRVRIRKDRKEVIMLAVKERDVLERVCLLRYYTA